MAGKLINQKMKNDKKKSLVVPESGMPFFMFLKFGAMAEIMRCTHWPPIQACTPYQTQAMAARLKTGQSPPQIPKLDRTTTGNEMW